jgi:hypothetical protein
MHDRLAIASAAATFLCLVGLGTSYLPGTKLPIEASPTWCHSVPGGYHCTTTYRFWNDGYLYRIGTRGVR